MHHHLDLASILRKLARVFLPSLSYRLAKDRPVPRLPLPDEVVLRVPSVSSRDFGKITGRFPFQIALDYEGPKELLEGRALVKRHVRWCSGRLIACQH